MQRPGSGYQYPGSVKNTFFSTEVAEAPKKEDKDFQKEIDSLTNKVYSPRD